MAIRFACPSCGQPIEIDDEWAGQSVACPYCRRVVAAPRESSWPPGNVPVAVPAGAVSSPSARSALGGITPPPPPAGVAPSRPYAGDYPRPQGAGLSSAGWALLLALFCGALSIFGWMIWFSPVMNATIEKAGTKATPDELSRTMQEIIMSRKVPVSRGAGWMAGTGLLCGIAALALAARSMIRQEGKPIMAIAACLLAALFVVCEALLALTLVSQHAGAT